VKRLCKTHNTITVNGQYPGPTLEINNGDTLVVKVINKARYNVTIHWYLYNGDTLVVKVINKARYNVTIH
jgi:hypothetical protein